MFDDVEIVMSVDVIGVVVVSALVAEFPSYI
jgi:hypothetical protein